MEERIQAHEKEVKDLTERVDKLQMENEVLKGHVKKLMGFFPKVDIPKSKYKKSKKSEAYKYFQKKLSEEYPKSRKSK